MVPFQLLVNAIAVIVILYAQSVLLRKCGVLEDERSQVHPWIITDLFQPAMIFTGTAEQERWMSC